MGYVAVRGGGKAIEESLRLLECERVQGSAAWSVDDVAGTFPELVDQVMGEASLYAPQLAALALKQAQGSPDEAVFLLRAFRSTLERPYVSRPVDTAEMRPDRRISAAFKDVLGGQILGATRDYSHRLLAFELAEEDEAALSCKREELDAHFAAASPVSAPASAPAPTTLPRVLDYPAQRGPGGSRRSKRRRTDGRHHVPAVVSGAALRAFATLSRGMTQAVEALGYAAIRGFGPPIPRWANCAAGLWPWPWTTLAHRETPKTRTILAPCP